MAKSENQPARLADVAANCGVTMTAVSAVLRGNGLGSGNVRVAPDTADRIRRVARELGYRPNVAARVLKGQPNNVLGVLIGADSTPANYERLSALEQEAYHRGFRLMIGQFRGGSDRTHEYAQDFLLRGIDCLMCFENPTPQYDQRVLKVLTQYRRVIFQTHRLIEGAYCVDVDRADGVRQAVTHLVQRDRHRIGLLLNDRPENDPLMGDRWRGYLAGLQAAGMNADPHCIWTGTGLFPPPPEVCDRAVEALVGRGRCDAVICSNDVWAIHFIKALRRSGRDVGCKLPGVGVIGFDNLDAAELFDPPLTTIDQNNAAFAKAAMDLLLSQINGPGDDERAMSRIVPAKLVVRESA